MVHPWDQGSHEEALEVLRRLGFGHLVTAGHVDGVPVVVPTQYVVAEEPFQVLLHLARPNPVWRALEADDTVVLSVAGDWSYVPSAWKAVGDEDPTLGVPTTYYAAVQVVARAVVLDDDAEKLEVLRAQLGEYEPELAAADPSEHSRLLRGIRGLRLEPVEVRCKMKYGGNVDDAHRAHVAAMLAQRRGPGDLVAKRHLERRGGWQREVAPG